MKDDGENFAQHYQFREKVASRYMIRLKLKHEISKDFLYILVVMAMRILMHFIFPSITKIKSYTITFISQTFLFLYYLFLRRDKFDLKKQKLLYNVCFLFILIGFTCCIWEIFSYIVHYDVYAVAIS
ncbi:hypothetical protein MXB_1187, partial [Myxobolus squamalis]